MLWTDFKSSVAGMQPRSYTRLSLDEGKLPTGWIRQQTPAPGEFVGAYGNDMETNPMRRSSRPVSRRRTKHRNIDRRNKTSKQIENNQ